MNTNKERITFLFQAYTSNRITEKDLKELSELTRIPESEFMITEVLKEYWDTIAVNDQLDIPREDILNRIQADKRFRQSPVQNIPAKVIRLRNVWPYAAAVLLVLTAGLTFYMLEKKPLRAVKEETMASKTIQPGSKKAILTLADGSQVALEQTIVGNIPGQANLKQDNGQLIYENNARLAPAAENAQNTITTPKGGEYQLILHDGTKVWLNAATRLSYPVQFSGSERRVKVEGEAYFEVAKNAEMPFIVQGNGTEVRVLGTHFNVSAYADDDYVKTTLVEGSVEVRKNQQKAMLKPGQEALINFSVPGIKVSDVDTEQALAWKNGYFMFDNQDIKGVMKLVGRWYNVDIAYQGNLAGKTFGGTISRFGDIRELLKSMELTGTIHFEIQGRRVIVKP
ncbi:FecR domain-containing protein [Pedobacter sp. AW31-3R]|uniref:FecR domain-containing protein n=1 Tax=Pedobacter sp. AW31-3R TaxID=3445781 RepID=UPI003FA00178